VDGLELLNMSFSCSFSMVECDGLELCFSFSLIHADGFDEVEIYDVFKEEFYELFAMTKTPIPAVSAELQVKSVALSFNDDFYSKNDVEKMIREYISSQISLAKMHTV
jgi:hypothetical protein